MKSYKNINDPQRSFVSAFVEKHVEKNQFFRKVKKVIDWASLDRELRSVYTKGLTDRGAKAYAPLLLFKMLLISEWYELSDTQTESMVNDSLSAMKFCDLTIEDSVPGHSTLSRFKKELRDKDAYDSIVSKFSRQLEKQNLTIENGSARVDARLKKTS
jgi:IS5 family transposase